MTDTAVVSAPVAPVVAPVAVVTPEPAPAPVAPSQGGLSLLQRVEHDAAPLLAIVLGVVDLVTGARVGRPIDLAAIGGGFAALGLPFLSGSR